MSVKTSLGRLLLGSPSPPMPECARFRDACRTFCAGVGGERPAKTGTLPFAPPSSGTVEEKSSNKNVYYFDECLEMLVFPHHSSERSSLILERSTQTKDWFYRVRFASLFRAARTTRSRVSARINICLTTKLLNNALLKLRVQFEQAVSYHRRIGLTPGVQWSRQTLSLQASVFHPFIWKKIIVRLGFFHSKRDSLWRKEIEFTLCTENNYFQNSFFKQSSQFLLFIL